LDFGWFGEHTFDVGAVAIGTGRLQGKYRPKLSCNRETCTLSGPHTIQAQGFIDVGASIKGHKVTKRWNLGDTGEMDANENLSFSFANPFGS
jgi:hypothetical protein